MMGEAKIRSAFITLLTSFLLLSPAAADADTGWGIGARFGGSHVELYDPRDNVNLSDQFFAMGLTVRYLFDLQPGPWSAGLELSLLLKEVPLAAESGVITEKSFSPSVPLLGVLQHDFRYVHARVLTGVATGYRKIDGATLCAGLGLEFPVSDVGLSVDYLYQHHLLRIQSDDGAGETAVSHLLLFGMFF